jgi:hypothetical protein
LGGWAKAQYIQKKRALGGTDRAVLHRREIMPDCVLKFCRGLYPNPVGQPYLGHKWA